MKYLRQYYNSGGACSVYRYTKQPPPYETKVYSSIKSYCNVGRSELTDAHAPAIAYYYRCGKLYIIESFLHTR